MLLLAIISLWAVAAAEESEAAIDLPWPRCAFYISPLLSSRWDGVASKIDERSRNKSAVGGSAECENAKDECAALWLIDGNTTTVLIQGCYDQNKEICSEDRCIVDHSLKDLAGHNGTSFWCCCRGQLCNSDEKLVFKPRNSTTTSLPSINKLAESDRSFYWTLFFVFLCVLLSIAVALLFLFFRRRRQAAAVTGQKIDGEAGFLLNPAPTGIDLDASKELCITLYNAIDVESLQLAEVIGHGRYGTVYRALRPDNGEPVAVKIFKDVNYAYFHNEVDVYCSPVMRDGHANLLRFLGAAEIVVRTHDAVDIIPTDDLRKEYWLAVELATERTLQEYLKSKTVDWEGFYSLALSVVGGLCFLHSEIRKDGEVIKPVIAHRDVSSRNVLVKSDGTAVISDLGFAMLINREELLAGQEIRLAEVGTVRYMAPEVLEGAVNLHDPAAALQQADVYACGLVLWEIFWRCENVWIDNGLEPAEYMAPFAKDVPPPPSLEQMQLWVCKKQVRPLFPNPCYSSGGQSYTILHTICNYIEDCWEKDPEGRATIACTYERFQRLRKTHKPMPGQKRIRQNLGLDGCSGLLPSEADGYLIDELPNYRSCDSSTQSDALLPVQPFQGRNPCQERNILTQDLSSESSNSLPGSSGRSVTRVTRSSFRKVDPNDPESLMAHLQAGRDPAKKNEPKDSLMQILLLNQPAVVKQPSPSINNPPEDPGGKSFSATE